MIRELTVSERKWVEDTLDSLSLREKIGQTSIEHAARLPLPDYSEAAVSEYLETNPIGSIFLAGEVIKGDCGSAEAYKKIIRAFQAKSRIPMLVAGDLEHGAGSAVASMTVFPNMMAVGAANDDNLAYELGRCTGVEGDYIGFNWTFSPVVDVLVNWLNPIVSCRGLGSNPECVAGLGKAIIKGMQDHGLAACAKHFPGDGVDFRDQHICTSLNSLPEEDWWKCHGRVFQEVIDAGVYTIMLGHIALPWLEGPSEDKNRYRPATVSYRITTELLRNRMGFKGVIISDALDMGGFTGWDSYEKRTVECFNSGTDAMLWPGSGYIGLMENALEDGTVSIEKLNDSVRRILELKVRLGLITMDREASRASPGLHETGSPDPEVKSSVKAISRKIAAKSITLVRNRKQLLPLKPKTLKRVLIGKMTRFTKDKEFSIDYFLGRLKDRGIEVEVLEDWNPFELNKKKETEGYSWDAFIMPFILPTHGLVNTVRPVGESAVAIWRSQMLDGLDPIVVSMSTPFLLKDMPYLDTLVNAYSYCEDSVDMLVKALFGEIRFNGCSPVDTGGW